MHWKKFLLGIHKIPRLLVKTFTVQEMNYLLTKENLAQPSQMQLSQKEKTFFEYFFAFLKSMFNFKHLPKKDEPHS